MMVCSNLVSEDLLDQTPAVHLYLQAIAGLISTGLEKCIKPHLNVNELLYLWQRAYITSVYFNKPNSLLPSAIVARRNNYIKSVFVSKKMYIRDKNICQLTLEKGPRDFAK